MNSVLTMINELVQESTASVSDKAMIGRLITTALKSQPEAPVKATKAPKKVRAAGEPAKAMPRGMIANRIMKRKGVEILLAEWRELSEEEREEKHKIMKKRRSGELYEATVLKNPKPTQKTAQAVFGKDGDRHDEAPTVSEEEIDAQIAADEKKIAAGGSISGSAEDEDEDDEEVVIAVAPPKAVVSKKSPTPAPPAPAATPEKKPKKVAKAAETTEEKPKKPKKAKEAKEAKEEKPKKPKKAAGGAGGPPPVMEALVDDSPPSDDDLLDE